MKDEIQKKNQNGKIRWPVSSFQFPVSGPAALRHLAAALIVAQVCFCFPSVHPASAAEPLDYRQAMRELVIAIAAHARASHPGFAVIPQNGVELLTADGLPTGQPALDYLGAIDAIGQESLFFGQPQMDDPTPQDETAFLLGFTELAKAMGKTVLVIDYCSRPDAMDASYRHTTARGYVGYAADRREMDRIAAHPALPFAVNPDAVRTLARARNFTYLINTGAFASRDAFVSAMAGSPFDLIIVDLFFHDGKALTRPEVARLQQKPGGARRLVVAYMSIGEAETYRFYWKPAWIQFPPAWLKQENPQWKGNYKVAYWDPAWQKILMGSPDSYLDRIVAAGFDGVYLDIIDGFQYFEQHDATD